MSLEWEQTIVDARDPGALGNWWREALGWIVVNDDPEEFEIRPAADRLPGLLFVRVPEKKTVKNRVHLDILVQNEPLEAARERLEGLGATTQRFVDNGEAGQHYIMQDIEGNEFCLVLGPES